MDFDFAAQRLTVIEHHGVAVEETVIEQREDHHGGDHAIAQNFVQVIRGEEVSKATLAEGVLSAAMCLAARASAETRTFQEIQPPRAAHARPTVKR
jgi:hypothetical protein